jgi:hypothetical protein
MLRDATMIGDFDRVLELVNQIEDITPELAQELRSLAERFDSEQLLTLLNTGGAS